MAELAWSGLAASADYRTCQLSTKATLPLEEPFHPPFNPFQLQPSSFHNAASCKLSTDANVF